MISFWGFANFRSFLSKKFKVIEEHWPNKIEIGYNKKFLVKKRNIIKRSKTTTLFIKLLSWIFPTSNCAWKEALKIRLSDAINEESKIIINQGTLEDKLEFDDLDPGLYQITFLSTEIVRVEIQGRGLYFSSMIIIGILILLNLIVLYLKILA